MLFSNFWTKQNTNFNVKARNQRNNDLNREIHVFQMMNFSSPWTYTNCVLERKLESPDTFGPSEPSNEIIYTPFLELELPSL